MAHANTAPSTSNLADYLSSRPELTEVAERYPDEYMAVCSDLYERMDTLYQPSEVHWGIYVQHTYQCGHAEFTRGPSLEEAIAAGLRHCLYCHGRRESRRTEVIVEPDAQAKANADYTKRLDESYAVAAQTLLLAVAHTAGIHLGFRERHCGAALVA